MPDEKWNRVLRAIRNRCRPYTEADVAMATGLSTKTVRKRLIQLCEAGLIRDRWAGTQGPFYEIESQKGD